MSDIPSDADEEPPGSAPAHWRFGTTADVGIGARGRTPEELFAQLGEGLTALWTDEEKVRPSTRREVEVAAGSPEGLVVAFLTELIGLFDEEGFLGAKYTVELRGRPPTSLHAQVQGEAFDPSRHPLRVQVKAATLHRLQVDLTRGIARVVMDI